MSIYYHQKYFNQMDEFDLDPPSVLFKKNDVVYIKSIDQIGLVYHDCGDLVKVESLHGNGVWVYPFSYLRYDLVLLSRA